MEFLKEIKKRAKLFDSNIVLPEANIDDRVYKACKYILKHRLSKITVFGSADEFDEDFKNEFCTIIDIKKSKKLRRKFANQLFELRKDKNLSSEEATNLVKQPNYFACMMVHNDMADGAVLGAKYTTKDAIMPALQIIKSKSKVSGLMTLYNDKKVFVFSDVSIQVSPNAEELADIAINAGSFAQKVLHIKPCIAMLSYSTLGSGEGKSVELVRSATNIVGQNSNFNIIGEIQADAALNGAIGLNKGLDKSIAGKANVLIFPNLDAGNIAYKLMTNLGGYKAIGPIVVGLNKPINDLSRGCTVDEIVNTVMITILQISK